MSDLPIFILGAMVGVGVTAIFALFAAGQSEAARQSTVFSCDMLRAERDVLKLLLELRDSQIRELQDKEEDPDPADWWKEGE